MNRRGTAAGSGHLLHASEIAAGIPVDLRPVQGGERRDFILAPGFVIAIHLMSASRC